MTSFFKIRHKPSGLFFKPSRYGCRSHLSKNGKVYQRQPSIKHIGNRFYHPDDSNDPSYRRPPLRQVVADEWEIVKFEVTETETFPLKTVEKFGIDQT